ncbi:hypothetical protein GIB67_028884, partial [Kingdonia uniflora]
MLTGAVSLEVQKVYKVAPIKVCSIDWWMKVALGDWIRRCTRSRSYGKSEDSACVVEVFDLARLIEEPLGEGLKGFTGGFFEIEAGIDPDFTVLVEGKLGKKRWSAVEYKFKVFWNSRMCGWGLVLQYLPILGDEEGIFEVAREEAEYSVYAQRYAPRVVLEQGGVEGSLSCNKANKNGRRYAKPWSKWDNGKIKILEWNEDCQQLGPNEPKLMSHLGNLARNGAMFPLTMLSWKTASNMSLDVVWKSVK